MILRRYGRKILSVRPNFDSRAMTEIGFVRDGEAELGIDEFEERYARRDGREFTAQARGDVQGEVEDSVLATLQEQLTALEAGLESGAVLLIENEQGVDQPKTRGTQTTTVVASENRLVFEYTIEPPLRLGIYAAR